ncbi:hypothetical protein DSCO28_70960 [Desulfosarcina ovata subsp. sediminis]|uniref:Uncharacterized protein n=1 Tax=Desulfosarcina ovata subsp. sediminis TaxID=885957 RepID=A0A5K8A2M1_9BACT|nr:hypothetical protein DSCO28_70960 [Desulfosarcina ovata subsp. sediminis]
MAIRIAVGGRSHGNLNPRKQDNDPNALYAPYEPTTRQKNPGPTDASIRGSSVFLK